MRCAAPMPQDLVDAVRANLGRVGGELGLVWHGLAWRLRLRPGPVVRGAAPSAAARADRTRSQGRLVDRDPCRRGPSGTGGH